MTNDCRIPMTNETSALLGVSRACARARKENGEKLSEAAAVSGGVGVQREALRRRNTGFVIRHWPAALMVVLIAPATVRAHRLDAAAWLDPGGVRVVARYPDGLPAAGATVLVFVRGGAGEGDDSFRGPPLFRDRLDPEGRFLFMPDSPRDLLCVIDDGIGHRVELAIHGKDLLVLLDRSSDAAERSPAPSARPIAVSDRPLALDQFPLWTRIAAGILTIALATILFSWLLRSRRRYAP